MLFYSLNKILVILQVFSIHPQHNVGGHLAQGNLHIGHPAVWDMSSLSAY